MQKNKIISTSNPTNFSTHPDEPIPEVLERIIGASLDSSIEYLKACQAIIKSKVPNISTYNLESFNCYPTVQNAIEIKERLGRCGHAITFSLSEEIYHSLPKKPFEVALETLTAADLKLLSLTLNGDHYTSPFCDYQICSQEDLGEYLGDYFSKTDNPNCIIAKTYIKNIVANATITDKTNPNKLDSEFDCWLVDQKGNKLGRLILTKNKTPVGLIELSAGTSTTLAYRNSGVATRLYNHMLQSEFTKDVDQGNSGFAKENIWLFHVKLKQLLADANKNKGTIAKSKISDYSANFEKIKHLFKNDDMSPDILIFKDYVTNEDLTRLTEKGVTEALIKILKQSHNPNIKESDFYEQALLESVPSAKLWHRNGFNPSSISLSNGFLVVSWEKIKN